MRVSCYRRSQGDQGGPIAHNSGMATRARYFSFGREPRRSAISAWTMLRPVGFLVVERVKDRPSSTRMRKRPPTALSSRNYDDVGVLCLVRSGEEVDRRDMLGGAVSL